MFGEANFSIVIITLNSVGGAGVATVDGNGGDSGATWPEVF